MQRRPGCEIRCRHKKRRKTGPARLFDPAPPTFNYSEAAALQTMTKPESRGVRHARRSGTSGVASQATIDAAAIDLAKASDGHRIQRENGPVLISFAAFVAPDVERCASDLIPPLTSLIPFGLEQQNEAEHNATAGPAADGAAGRNSQVEPAATRVSVSPPRPIRRNILSGAVLKCPSPSTGSLYVGFHGQCGAWQSRDAGALCEFVC